MTKEEFNEIKGIAMEMKVNRKTKVLTTTPIAIAAPSMDVTVVGSTSQIPTAPYATIVQVQPVRVQPSQQKEKSDDVEVTTISAQRKSERQVKVKQEPTLTPKKRVKKTSSGPEKRRKTMQISEFEESDEETEEKPVQQAVGEGRAPMGEKSKHVDNK